MAHPAPESSLVRRFRFETSDPGVFESGIARLWGDVRASLPDDFEWRAEGVDLGPVAVTRGRFFGPASVDIRPRAHSLLFPNNCSLQVSAHRGSADVAPGAAGVASPGRLARLSALGQVDNLSLRIQSEFLLAELSALTGEAPREPLELAPVLSAAAGAGAHLERLCRFIVSDPEAVESLAHPAVVAGLLESVSRVLLTGHQHNLAHLLDRPAAAAGWSSVRRVQEYLDAHAGTPVFATDLAASAGADLRAVEAAFERHSHTSPAAFLRSRRLHLARRMLLWDLQIPVPRVAYAAGFPRAQTFEAEYVRTFGERPEDTRRRGLLAGGLPPDPAPEGPPPPERLSLLSAREREVCVRVARGMLNKQIAADLGLSERTVKEYRAHAMAKLGAGSAADLVSIVREAEKAAK